MAVTRYTYTVSPRNDLQLDAEIAALGLPGFLGICCSGTSMQAVFADALTSPQEASLAALAANHTPDPSDPLERRRTLSEALIDDSSNNLVMLIRAIVLGTVKELNILRRQVIGIVQNAWDPANIANGSGLTSPNVTVSGAAFGDCVSVAAPYSLQGITATGYVSAPDTVTVRLENQTGSGVNLASGQWKVVVWRPEVMSPRTKQMVRNTLKADITAGNADTLE